MSARSIYRLILLVVAVFVGVIAARMVPPPLPEWPRAEFMDEVRAGRVMRIEIQDQEVILGQSTTGGGFRTGFDRQRDAGLPNQLRALGVEIRFSKSAPGI